MGDPVFKLCATNYYKWINGSHNSTKDIDDLLNKGVLNEHLNYCSYLK